MKFRYARHTSNLEKLETFYTKILNFDILGGFENHDGYDGLFLGKKDADWHLEFTKSDELAKQTFDEDDLLVFYPESNLEFKNVMANIQLYSVKIEVPKNPYWKENGIKISDPDGFGIIISKI